MSSRPDRNAEYTRRKEFCALHNLCFKCRAPKGTNKTNCDACMEARRATFKAKRTSRLQVNLCACGCPLESGKKACSHCLHKIRKSTKKARKQYVVDGNCGTCGGPVSDGKSCGKCRERATRATMKRYRTNILNLVCACCGGKLSDHTFRCEKCNKAHVTRTYLEWHRRRRKVFVAYGNKCACCGITQEEFLEVDHIAGGGTKHQTIAGKRHFYGWIIKNGYPDILQLLCANCNRGKGKFGVCPHERDVPDLSNKHSRRWRRRRLKAIIKYGERCICCGEARWWFLEFDHVNNDGNIFRKQQHGSRHIVKWIMQHNYPNSIQLLCSNCNKAKGQYGCCPHKQEP